MIVVDSSVLIDHLNGKLTWQVQTLRDIGRREILLIGDIVLLEVLQGVRSDRHAEIVARSLRAYATAPMLNAELAFRAAAHHRALRRLGITVRTTIDLIIGTFCIANKHVLLHNDRDFLPMSAHLGLQCLAPPVH